MERSSKCQVRISEGEKREIGGEEIFKEVLPENFPEMRNDINLQIMIQRGQVKQSLSRQSIVKFLNASDKEEM